jgi:formylmethanofuran--tetrahydromethanopterin N-formyltransferase
MERYSEAIREAMKAAVDSVRDIEGLVKISAGNYGGKLGRYKIFLREIVE